MPLCRPCRLKCRPSELYRTAHCIFLAFISAQPTHLSAICLTVTRRLECGACILRLLREASCMTANQSKWEGGCASAFRKRDWKLVSCRRDPTNLTQFYQLLDTHFLHGGNSPPLAMRECVGVKNCKSRIVVEEKLATFHGILQEEPHNKTSPPLCYSRPPATFP